MFSQCFYLLFWLASVSRSIAVLQRSVAYIVCTIAFVTNTLFELRSSDCVCSLSALILSEQVDPDTEGPGLPMKESEEFRPFSRRLPEFKFWIASTRAVLYAFGMTFFEVGRDIEDFEIQRRTNKNGNEQWLVKEAMFCWNGT